MAEIGEAAIEGGSEPRHAAGAGAAGLRPLAGWKFTLFRVLWFYALALALGGTLAGIHYRNVWYDKEVRPIADLGLRSETPAVLLGPPVGAEARAAGIVGGSRLIAIDGKIVPEGARRREIAALLDRPEGAQVLIRTRSPEGVVREHVLTRNAGHVAEAYAGSGITHSERRMVELLLDLAASMVNIVAAILLFQRRARDPVAAMLSLAWLFLVAGDGVAWEALTSLGLNTLSITARMVGYGALFAGIAIFPDGRLETRWRRVLMAAIAFWVLVFFVDWSDVVDLPDSLTLLGGIALLAASVVSLAGRYRRLPMGIERQQIRWALLGFAIGTALGSATGIIDMLGFANVDGIGYIWLNLLLSIVGSIAFAFLPLGLLVSLLKYRLYDADAAISRSAGYAVLTLLLGGTFAAGAKGMEWFVETYFGRDAGALPGVIGAGLAVVLITPMHNRIQSWAERRFQKPLLHLRRGLPQCVDDLRETAGMKALLDEVLARVEAGTRAVRSAVVIDGERVATRGEEGDYPIVVPLRIGHQETEIGSLLVGPRPDGSRPGKDERNALEDIADPIARAMRIVLLREAREAQDEARHRRFETRFAALEAAVARLLGTAERGKAAG